MKDKDFTAYKFKAIKVYSSNEWMAGSTKKYRSVFDRAETTYIRVEFSFFNKLFDEKEWDVKISLKAFRISETLKDEICSIDTRETIKISENIVYIREGWGNATPGGFWKKGEYAWEAYIDDKFISSKKFYINDIGLVKTGSENPYFTLQSVKMFGGGYDWIPKEKRKYLKKFKQNNTRYIWVEVTFKNKVNDIWQSELFYNFYDEAGQLKGQTIVQESIKVEKNQNYISASGWGNKEIGSWSKKKYTVEIVFMDSLIAIVPFEVGDAEIEGVGEVFTTGNLQPLNIAPEKEESLDDVMQKLEELIGLEEIKKKIKDHINYLNFIKLRKEKGLDDKEEISLHSIFTGNPGTGKTTLVKMLGKIYHKMGLLSVGHVHEVDRADLVGEFIGQTAPKVRKAIDEAKGGILFIDEAYMLAREGDSKDYGKEVIEVLIKEISDGNGDIAIMVAGYPKEMENFIQSNPGLKSRFKYHFHFEDYTPDELLQIAQFAASKRLVSITPEAQKLIQEIMIESYRTRTNSFGNARYAYAIIDEGKMNMGLRLMQRKDIKKLSEEKLSTIEKEDIQKIINSKIKREIEFEINEKLLHEALEELNSLVGLNNIKNDVNELVKLIRYYRETGKNVLNKFSIHTVFTGNPGTGKTSVARIVGKIYKALGLLEKGHTVECDRETLIGGFVGQTALKTKDKIDASFGGVMFIDEAYALSEGRANDYGKEAIEVILKNMEDKRGEFAVIVAGYPENMKHFLEVNPGLKSRFDRHLKFRDFTPDELYRIALSMLKNEDLKPDAKTAEYLKDYFSGLHKNRDKFFGNARTVRKIIEKCIKNQNLRMASLERSARTEEMIKTLQFEDVQEFVLTEQRNKRIGFKY